MFVVIEKNVNNSCKMNLLFIQIRSPKNADQQILESAEPFSDEYLKLLLDLTNHYCKLCNVSGLRFNVLHSDI